jgi:hypothetical protein
MYVNGKMRPVETISGMEVKGGIKENGGGGEFEYDIFDNCKNFCKYHNVPLAQQFKKKGKKIKFPS